MVSMALFTIVVTVAAAAYLSMINLSRRAQATNDVVSNLTFVVESISRSLRTGTNYDCGLPDATKNCWPSPGSQITFTDEDAQTVSYLQKSNGTIGMCIGVPTCTDAASTAITDPRIAVSSLQFYVQGAGTGDATQPRVIIALTGTVTVDANSPPVAFSIQTGATQRLIDL
jgi:hypothetical protein